MRTGESLYHPQNLFDVLRIPMLGRLLRWRWGRLVIQLPLVLISALLLYDGFTGPQIGSRNLATVTVWIHYRGLVVLALLLAGNLFCMGCPFMLTRTLAHRLSKRGRRWPKALRHKWIAIGGLFLIFWLYEWLSLWASPWLTVWLILAYFGASFVLEAMFTESPFCKYVCPLGNFNFVYSTLSPLQIRARDPAICKTCVGKECVNGSYREEPIVLVDQIQDGAPVKSHEDGPQGVLGCGTLLYVPQIRSNMDCTFCLDCARACPHNNVALAVRSPLRELGNVAAWPKRWDLGFLVISLAFMGMFNAFGMVSPIYDFLDGVARITGIQARGIQLLILFLLGNLSAPALLSFGAAWLSVKLAQTTRPAALRLTFASFAPAFVPIGLGIWVAHYGYHFLTGVLAIIPVFQNFLLDNHLTVFGTTPNWSLSGIASLPQIGLFQAVALIGGYLISLVVLLRLASRLYRRRGSAQRAILPWVFLMAAMMLFTLWVLSKPMDMRDISPLSFIVLFFAR
jgi:polyferredoxin